MTLPNPKGSKAKTTVDTGPKIYAPIGGKPVEFGGYFGEARETHTHMGLDIDCPVGTPCIAPVDGRIVNFAQDHGFAPGEGAKEGGGMIQFQFLQDVGPIKKGDVIGWGHVFHVYAQVGETVKAGQKIASSGETTFNHAAHVHFIYQSPATGEMDGSDDPKPVYEYLRTNGKDSSGFTEGGGPVEPGQSSSADIEAVAKGAAISAFLQLPSILEYAESQALKGQRSLMNDQPLLPFIEQLCTGSLRSFMSLPNGNFFAFIPDYFGGLTGRNPYWSIHDIEILNGQIELSDDALATHVYVVGDTSTINGSIDLVDKWQTAGVVTVFNAFMADFINGVNAPIGEKVSKAEKKEYEDKLAEIPSLASKDKALSFLNKYGARPYYEEAPMIRSHFFEMFLAYQRFCLLWSKQFLTTFEFTFMPELIPGGIVRFPEHGIQCYIDEVVHEGDYENGFTTRAALSAPAAIRDNHGNPTQPMQAGMIRGGIFNPENVHPIGESGKGNRGQTG